MNSTEDSTWVQTLHLDSFDPEAMEDPIHDNSFDHVQLAKGRFQANLMHARLGDYYVDSGIYNLPLLAQGDMSEDFIFLGFLLSAGGQGFFNGHPVSEATLAIMTEGTEMHYRLAQNSHWLALMIDREMLESTGVFVPAHFEAPVRLESRDRAFLQKHLLYLHSLLQEIERDGAGISRQSAYMANLEAEVIDTFSTVLVARPTIIGSDNGISLAKIVDRATEFMKAHLDQPLRMAQVSQAIGTSWRTLDRAFATVHGIAPKHFLQLLRLTRIRRLLLGCQESCSVTELAARCGIFHPGRFASAYRGLYGEFPLQTLKASKGRVDRVPGPRVIIKTT